MANTNLTNNAGGREPAVIALFETLSQNAAKHSEITMPTKFKPPFSWFGGKGRIAPAILLRFGRDFDNLVELFGGSAAVTLTNILHNHAAKPVRALVNDSDCLLVNLWRAIKDANPNKLTPHCRQNYSEIDLIAWHRRLGKIRETFRTELENDVCYYDFEIAGRTLWAYRGWIGGGFADPGVKANSKMPRAVISNWIGGSPEAHIAFFQQALENVQFFCGDWKRALSRTQTELIGTTAMVFDPPYPLVSCAQSYAHHENLTATESRYKAIELGEKPNFRIAYCGYFDLHDRYFPPTWERLPWKSAGGYGNQARNGRGRHNSKQETIWFSPLCLRPTI